MGERSAGNPHAAFDVDGAGDVARHPPKPARQSSTLPYMKSGPSGTPSLVGLLVCGYLLMLVLLLQGLVVLTPDLRQIDGRLWEPHV